VVKQPQKQISQPQQQPQQPPPPPSEATIRNGVETLLKAFQQHNNASVTNYNLDIPGRIKKKFLHDFRSYHPLNWVMPDPKAPPLCDSYCADNRLPDLTIFLARYQNIQFAYQLKAIYQLFMQYSLSCDQRFAIMSQFPVLKNLFNVFKEYHIQQQQLRELMTKVVKDSTNNNKYGNSAAVLPQQQQPQSQPVMQPAAPSVPVEKSSQKLLSSQPVAPTATVHKVNVTSNTVPTTTTSAIIATTASSNTSKNNRSPTTQQNEVNNSSKPSKELSLLQSMKTTTTTTQNNKNHSNDKKTTSMEVDSPKLATEKRGQELSKKLTLSPIFDHTPSNMQQNKNTNNNNVVGTMEETVNDKKKSQSMNADVSDKKDNKTKPKVEELPKKKTKSDSPSFEYYFFEEDEDGHLKESPQPRSPLRISHEQQSKMAKPVPFTAVTLPSIATVNGKTTTATDKKNTENGLSEPSPPVLQSSKEKPRKGDQKVAATSPEEEQPHTQEKADGIEEIYYFVETPKEKQGKPKEVKDETKMEIAGKLNNIGSNEISPGISYFVDEPFVISSVDEETKEEVGETKMKSTRKRSITSSEQQSTKEVKGSNAKLRKLSSNGEQQEQQQSVPIIIDLLDD
jgi:hypothetical protein